jgi:hypothetical protein
MRRSALSSGSFLAQPEAKPSSGSSLAQPKAELSSGSSLAQPKAELSSGSSLAQPKAELSRQLCSADEARPSVCSARMSERVISHR